ncbi:MAG: chemotaxis protein CheW [Gammaproteobacteria bacterium]
MTNVTTIDSRISEGMAALHAKKLNIVHCLFIPLKDELLLLPNSNVAEVVAYEEPTPFTDAPPWLLGRITWRERLIPLIAFGVISGRNKKSTMSKNSRIIVLNTLNGNSELPYISIITQGIPHLESINEKNITDVADSEDDGRQSILRHVMVDDKHAMIPDVDDMEIRLIRLHG